jgi:hypothetical protein
VDALTKQERVLEVAKGFRLRYRFASQSGGERSEVR